ncbi:hypothetical protein K7472_10165 [Streptomyces sp. PTM05]|uniref:SH3 domain-containing protein n=1 Tax=Streptantibioticus parmotrematis TaxID=2873249 RepID=A0ABS7QPU2_9ACTN|nr:hypothetical protein [Streptantibioticus parmotrematis]MBY8885208.1 hypothetical protein [Streptantibioticus parmotrematis]
MSLPFRGRRAGRRASAALAACMTAGLVVAAAPAPSSAAAALAPSNAVAASGAAGAARPVAAAYRSPSAARPADGHGPGTYEVWATDVNVRDPVDEAHELACDSSPSTTNCGAVVATLSSPETVYVACQQPGETIGGNPYWLSVRVGAELWGWMAGYYVKNHTDSIDGLPRCS